MGASWRSLLKEDIVSVLESDKSWFNQTSVGSDDSAEVSRETGISCHFVLSESCILKMRDAQKEHDASPTLIFFHQHCYGIMENEPGSFRTKLCIGLVGPRQLGVVIHAV